MRRGLLALIFFLCCVVQGMAQERFGVAYYDVDKFYDTIPSKFYDDRAYTPSGKLGWNTEHYRRKVENVARVVDSMAMPVVVLYGAENESVVRDVVSASNQDYAYIHRTQDYNDGLDFAVLYFADKFFVESITPWRGALCVEGEAAGQKLTIVATNRCSSLGVLFAERNLNREGNRIVLLGQPSKAGFRGLGLQDYTADAERAGRGNTFVNGSWIMRDRVASNISGVERCDVYIKHWLLDKNAVPMPTYDNGRYRGGYSSSLPIYIYFREIF